MAKAYFFSSKLLFLRDKMDQMAKEEIFSSRLLFLRDKRDQIAKANFFWLTLICEGQKGQNGQSIIFFL